jgi:hypothetical protein
MGLRVAKQRFEAVVHVLLNVAVKQGQARLVGYKVHYGATIIWNYYCIFYNAPGFGAVHFYQFELMAMQMEGVGVIRAVAKYQAVTSSLL